MGFTYDAAGRRTSVSLPNGITMAYTYDIADQLTGIDYKQGATVIGDLTYEYDEAGNRVAAGGSFARTGLPPALTSAVYDAANRLVQWGGAALTYDDNGNLTSDGSASYAWNARDQLAAMSGASFQYDGLGRRTGKTVGGWATSYLHDGMNVVGQFGAQAATLLTGLGIDETFMRTDSAGARHFFTDALGSTLALADAAGAVQTEYTYEPFGKTTAAGQGNANPFQYTGRENDDTGLYYYRARYYHPVLQRFISEDPIGSGMNFYAYVHNDPIDFVDPFGLQDNASPWQVGWEWLTGQGPRVHHFKDSDPFTELLRHHQHIQQLINDVCSGKKPLTGDAPYNVGGLAGVPKYFKDYSTLLTAGHTGNLAATYLGSYQLHYSVANGALNIQVYNPSTIASATHPPYIGYTQWWSNNIGKPLNNLFSSGPMSTTEQYFDIHENLAGRGCGCNAR